MRQWRQNLTNPLSINVIYVCFLTIRQHWFDTFYLTTPPPPIYDKTCFWMFQINQQLWWCINPWRALYRLRHIKKMVKCKSFKAFHHIYIKKNTHVDIFSSSTPRMEKEKKVINGENGNEDGKHNKQKGINFNFKRKMTSTYCGKLWKIKSPLENFVVLSKYLFKSIFIF